MKKIVIFALLLPAIAHAGGRQEVTREEFGEAWPFTVDSGVVACRSVSSVIFITDRKIYAVNGLAMSDGIYEDIKEIWRVDPEAGKYGAPRVNLSPILSIGLDLCN